MSKNFVPSREADLVAFSRNMSVLINADPLIYGLDAKQGTDFQALFDAFDALFIACNDPGTRTPTAIQNKKTAKVALVAEIRRLAAIIQAHPGTTDGMRRDLNLTVRDYEPTPVPVPGTAPSIDFISVVGNAIKIRLHNADSTKRARPANVTGATVFTFVGEAPPADIAGWKFEGNTKETTVDINMPPTTTPGSKVWVTSFWRNSRDQSGPATTPVFTWTNNGGVSKAA